MPISEKFPDLDLDAMVLNLNRLGEPYDIRFKKMERLYNSRAALEASELARDKGVYDEMHNRLFSAYSGKGKNIADPEILHGIAEECGLNRDELRAVLTQGTYLPRLTSAMEDARKLGITGAPTFVLNDKQIVPGAQPLEKFRALLAGETGEIPLHHL